MRRALPAIALIVAVNAVVLVGVAWNRSGEPEAMVELTERELGIPYWGWRENTKDNTGLLLELDVEYDSHQPEWFDCEKLDAIGFDCRRAEPPDPNHPERSRDQVPRRAYIALELEGEPWQAWQEKQKRRLAETEQEVARREQTADALDSARKTLENDLVSRSRLFAVDAGPDPEVLRKLHPDRSRVFIVPALVDMTYDPNQRFTGFISSYLVHRIHVPRRHRALLDEIVARELEASRDPDAWQRPWDSPPRYAVTVACGRRLEPWIVSVRSLDPPAAAD